MPLGDKAKAALPLRAATLKQQAMITRQSGNAASGKLVWNQHYSFESISQEEIQLTIPTPWEYHKGVSYMNGIVYSKTYGKNQLHGNHCIYGDAPEIQGPWEVNLKRVKWKEHINDWKISYLQHYFKTLLTQNVFVVPTATSADLIVYDLILGILLVIN